MAERLIPDNTLFSSIMKQNQGMSSDEVNRAIDAKINELVSNRLSSILDEKMKQSTTTWKDTLPDGSVNPIGPHGFIFGQKWMFKDAVPLAMWYFEANNNMIDVSYAHMYQLAKIGIIFEGDNRLVRVKESFVMNYYLTEDKFPIFFKYLKSIDYPFFNVKGKKAYRFRSGSKPEASIAIYVGDVGERKDVYPDFSMFSRG